MKNKKTSKDLQQRGRNFRCWIPWFKRLIPSDCARAALLLLLRRLAADKQVWMTWSIQTCWITEGSKQEMMRVWHDMTGQAKPIPSTSVPVSFSAEMSHDLWRELVAVLRRLDDFTNVSMARHAQEMHNHTCCRCSWAHRGIIATRASRYIIKLIRMSQMMFLATRVFTSHDDDSQVPTWLNSGNLLQTFTTLSSIVWREHNHAAYINLLRSGTIDYVYFFLTCFSPRSQKLSSVLRAIAK